MRKGRSDQIILQLDDELIALSGKRAFRPRSPAEPRGDKWFITDFGGVEGRVMQVDAPPKYASFVILRRLVENGELEQSDRVVIHWRQKRDRTSTEAFFTPLRADTLQDALREADDDPAQHLVFGLNSVLLAGVQEAAKKGVVALLFEHGRHVDLLIARNGQPLRASRMSAYSDEAKAALAQSVETELRSVQAELRVELDSVVYAGWAFVREEGLGSSAFGGDTTSDTSQSGGASIAVGSWASGAGASALETQMGSEWVRQMARDLEVQCTILPISRYEMGDGEALLTSLPALIERMPASQTLSPQPHYWAYAAQRSAPWVASVAWVGVAGLFSTTLWLQTEASAMDTEIDQLATQVERDVREIPELPDDHDTIVEFAAELERLRESPAIKDVLADLSGSAGEGIRVRAVRMTYDDQLRASIRVEGRIRADFEEATNAHREFIDTMEGMGYRIEASDLRTDVDRLDFDVTFRTGEGEADS